MKRKKSQAMANEQQRNLQMSSSVYAFNWFNHLFLESMRFSLALVAFDVVFSEGMRGLFIISLAMLKMREEEIVVSDFRTTLSLLSEVGFTCTRKEFILAIEDCSVAVRNRFEKALKEYNDSCQED